MSRRSLLIPLAVTLCACAAEAPAPAPAFHDVTAERGVAFTGGPTFRGDFPLPEIMGSGCAVLDADGDGRLDLYFLAAAKGPGEGAPNRLLRQTSDGRFEDVTDESGLGDRGYGTGVAVGDVDNDGDLDVYVGNWGPDALYLNDGSGRFHDATEQAGIRGDTWTTSCTFLDYDLDGFLDLFVVRYVDPTPGRMCGGGEIPDYCAPGLFDAVPDTLYRNRGDGTFEDVSAASAIASTASSGLGVATADFDGDGWIDVFVANDQRPNHLWINQGDGTFREEAMLRGVALSALGDAEASMGVALGDVNGDGRLDVVCTHLFGETNTVYLGNGSGHFDDRTTAAGLAAASRAATGFGTALLDLDLDGDLDFVVANGRVRRGAPPEDADAPQAWAGYAEEDQLFLNDGAGGFAEVSPFADSPGPAVSRGLVAADLDSDGDLDLVVTCIGAPARVLDNVAPKRGHWLRVRAVDADLNRDVLGARVEVTVGTATWTRVVGAGWSYQCSAPASAHFGLGHATEIEQIDVTWPGGDRESFPGGPTDREVTLIRGRGAK